MYDAVDISDDEDSLLLETGAGVIPKDENWDYDLPQPNACPMPRTEDVASSSGTNVRSSFIGMGFAPSLVDKAIEENGEGNSELILETLFAYSDLQTPKTEVLDDGFFSGLNNSSAAKPHAAKEHDVGDSDNDEKTLSLLKMNFSLDEVGFAMQRLGAKAPIGKLMDFIFAARMVKKYEKDTSNSTPGNEETGMDCNNEAIFGIMEKSLLLLEMGFSENDISAAFERCGSEASAALLAESIVTGGTCPLPEKRSSTYLSPSAVRKSVQSLKRKTGECLPICIKTEGYGLDMASQDGSSNLLEEFKFNMPEVDIDEATNFKKPKEEILEDSGNCAGRMLLEARLGSYPSSSVRNPAPDVLGQAARMSSIEEDWKPAIFLPNPPRSLTSAAAKPPYFLYGNVTSLSPTSWARITKFMYSIEPEFVESQMFSALNRKEGYVHNLPRENRSNIFPKGAMTIAEAIPRSKRWWPSWDNRKQLTYINESTGSSYLCERLGRILAECNGSPSEDQQRNILQQCLTMNFIWVGRHRLSPLEPEHLEQIMGYPQHHTQIVGYSSAERMKALRVSFQTDTLAYHLSVLSRLCPEGVTVLSFFTGIGGAEVALHRLGIRLKGVVSVEACETKRKIVKKWWESSAQCGELVQLESISKLTTAKLEDLMKKMKGFDLIICQNSYSSADNESMAGLDLSMFAEFVRILQKVRSTNGRYR